MESYKVSIAFFENPPVFHFGREISLAVGSLNTIISMKCTTLQETFAKTWETRHNKKMQQEDVEDKTVFAVHAPRE